MRLNDDGKTVAAMDMLVPRVIFRSLAQSPVSHNLTFGTLFLFLWLCGGGGGKYNIFGDTFVKCTAWSLEHHYSSYSMHLSNHSDLEQ